MKVAAVTCLKFLAWVAVLLAPAKAAFAAVTVLVVGDFITGVWASLVEGRKVTSSGLAQTVFRKFLPYQFAILMALQFENYVGALVPLVRVITGFILSVEIKSVFENLRRITGLDLWSRALSVLQPQKLNPDKTPPSQGGQGGTT